MVAPKQNQEEPSEEEKRLALVTAQLKEIERASEAGREQLQDIQSQIKMNQRDLDRQVESFSYTLERSRKELQAAHDTKRIELQTDIEICTNELLVLTRQKTEREKDIQLLADTHNTMVQEAAAATVSAQTTLQTYENAILLADKTVKEKKQELIRVVESVQDQNLKLARITGKITETEKIYIDRIETLQVQQTVIEGNIQKSRNALGSYELSMKTIREKDEQHARELETRERTLIAKTRALNEERMELTAAKRRFMQTEQLQ